MTYICASVKTMDTVQVGKKYVALQGNEVRIVEVLDNGTARVGLHTVIGSFGVNVDTRYLHFLAEVPEEKKQQSIFDNPYYEVEAARLQGKTIQIKGCGGVWEDMLFAPNYDLPPEDYRIKPETKTVYKCRYEFEDVFGQIEASSWTSGHADDIVDIIKLVKRVQEDRPQFKKWIIEPECTPIEVEVQ